jgi:hypothetical protein
MFVPVFAQAYPSLRDGVPALVPVRGDLDPRIGVIRRLAVHRGGQARGRDVHPILARRLVPVVEDEARRGVGVDRRVCLERRRGLTWCASRPMATPTGWPQPGSQSKR